MDQFQGHQHVVGQRGRGCGGAAPDQPGICRLDTGPGSPGTLPPQRVAGMLFDDTQIEVSGPSFQGAKINYEGNLALSWQTLWAGPLLADSIFGPPSQTKESPNSQAAGHDVSGCLPQLLAQNQSLWDKAARYLYADSASSAGKYLEAIAQHFGAWSVSYNKWVEPLEKKAQELPEREWSAMENTQ